MSSVSHSGVERSKSPLKPILMFIALAVIALFVNSMSGMSSSVKKSYGFLHVDHPVEMWNDGRDRWVYYSIGKPDVDGLAAEARKELIGRGFTEDTSKKPWYRFARGNEEVIICSHDEIELNGTKLMPSRSGKGIPKPTTKWAVVHVKNGPGSEGPLVTFQALKLLYRW